MAQNPITVLRELLRDNGIYWILSALATLVREDASHPEKLRKRVAKSIEQARDAI